MESEEGSRDDLMQRLWSSLAASPSSLPKQYHHLSPPPPPPPLQNPFANSFGLLHGDPSGAPLRCLPSGSSAGNIASSYTAAATTNSSNSNKRPAGTPPPHPHVPPASPYSQIPTPGRSPAQQSSPQPPGHGHARSLSQPAALFSLDSLPSLSPPSCHRESPSTSALSDPMSTDVPMEDRDNSSPAPAATPPPGTFSRSTSGRTVGSFPPLKAHRRSLSEIPLGFSQSSFPMVVPPLSQRPPQGLLESSASARDDLTSAGRKAQGQFLRKEWDWGGGLDKSAEGVGGRKSEEDVGDDLLDVYMNLDGQDALNSSGTEEKHEELDSRASVTKTNGADCCSESEAESSVSESVNSLQQINANVGPSLVKKEGTKRSAVGDPGLNINPSRHFRSVSMDSFMGSVNFEDELPKLPPSSAIKVGQHSHNKSLDEASDTFSLELGNGDFNGPELKKIMDEKLVDIALTDPKRAKRILANRQSAARSKERKLRYITELEHKVQTLQTEATTLSAQLTQLQRDSAGLTSQNNALKFRLQAMEQQSQLRDALNEALTAEVRHLKLATQGLAVANSSGNLNQHLSVNPQLFPLHLLQQQQPLQLPMYQLQQQRSQEESPQQQQHPQLQYQQQQQEKSFETKTSTNL